MKERTAGERRREFAAIVERLPASKLDVLCREMIGALVRQRRK